MSIAVLRQMFEQMVEKKDSAAIDRFYDPSFVMSSNGIARHFDAFAASHRTIYATPIYYSVEYDEQACRFEDNRPGSPAGYGLRPAAPARAPPASKSC